jgi:MoaA/NifB/PqqE/SkfB family radical SAM enzyme
MKKYLKKTIYVWKVFYWFVWYNLLNGEQRKVWHLIKVMTKHYAKGTPYAAIIETSNTCNFRCPTCPTTHKLIHARRPPEAMSLDKFKKIIDNIKDDVHVVYLYNSNEPLLHPDIVEMIRYASSQDLHTMISSNCSLLTEEMSLKLLDSGLGEIRFALDGLTAESFETFRRGGDYLSVRKNIERFCELKNSLGRKRPIATLQFILNKLNQDQVEDIKKFSKDNHIDKLYIKPFIMSPYAYSPEEIEDLSKRFFADKDINDDYIVYRKDEHGLVAKTDYKTCPDVRKVFTILADGRAVMCCFDLYGDYSYGRMDEMKLPELWFSEQAAQMRAFAYQRKLPLCKVCGNVE